MMFPTKPWAGPGNVNRSVIGDASSQAIAIMICLPGDFGYGSPGVAGCDCQLCYTLSKERAILGRAGRSGLTSVALFPILELVATSFGHHFAARRDIMLHLGTLPRYSIRTKLKIDCGVRVACLRFWAPSSDSEPHSEFPIFTCNLVARQQAFAPLLHKSSLSNLIGTL
ncbi:hypothetical protein BU24DRAFT_256019 [Aaosphaeria arxii CBS 175.79]|uniref:Uncharacterized protein n=1 Tax=Aaosphaeria arxii CBS 175.79 TaxID=1450172 RepID=A0A6A5XHA1_9PLEO|nr:uncharacterized protein BU24DRAFT_256019 [Aaosphaeria arxii CBS 175.79]KAF2012635.1 hypothetical protein BU24DRAFT_256019 [Aaosphaeria arxii CBS 175.79]